MARYAIILEEENNHVVAKCPELDIVSQGSTMGTALDNIKEAIELVHEGKAVKPKKKIEIATVEVKTADKK